MNQEKIIQAIAAYLEKETYFSETLIKDQKTRQFMRINVMQSHSDFCQEIAAELADAIAPHLEAGAGWENAPSWAEWRTVDGNGDITYWKDKPEPSKRNDYWTLARGDRYEQIPHTVKDWKETLQKRPR